MTGLLLVFVVGAVMVAMAAAELVACCVAAARADRRARR